MTLLQGELGSDVAHVNIQMPVSIQISEVHTHALKGITAELLGGHGGKSAFTFQ